MEKQVPPRHDTTGIRDDRPPLPITFSETGCAERHAIDFDRFANGDMLAGECYNSLDERCKAAGTQSAPEIAALPCLFECGCSWRADEHEISDRDIAVKRLDAPQPEWLAWRQVQSIAANPPGRDKTGDDYADTRQRQE